MPISSNSRAQEFWQQAAAQPYLALQDANKQKCSKQWYQ